jgi:hypothetical protein
MLHICVHHFLLFHLFHIFVLVDLILSICKALGGWNDGLTFELLNVCHNDVLICLIGDPRILRQARIEAAGAGSTWSTDMVRYLDGHQG